ncbi:hypothetical protein IGI04_019208 [Brassica rapa subsp. trilocularis]|uniref:Uncharacterized protein n=1 Tax=Brassica rapa subsp. trilocularis TaxID=1813537 RepID=A0ABQ7MII8_BRACM|nr:hypothetical protein IGI04_019208 [Brassica rapa subsp. trilocularis]
MIFLIKYFNKSSKSLKLMERGVKHVCVHIAVDKLRLFLKNYKFHLFIRIIIFDDEQVNPKSRVSTVLSQQLGFKSDNKRFQVVVSE